MTDADTRSGLPDRLREFFSPRKAPLWIVVAFVLYNLLGFFVVPWVAQDQIPKQAKSILGLDAQVGIIEFNPWTLTARIEDLNIDDPDGQSLTGFNELFVNLQTSSLFNFAVTLKEVRLTKPRGHFLRYSFTDSNVLRALNAAPPPPAADESGSDGAAPDQDSGLFPVIIYALSIDDGSITVEDRLPKTPFKTDLGPVDIAVENFSTLPDKEGGQQVSIVMENGAAVEWSGSLQVGPLLSNGSLRLSGPVLPLAYRYIQDDVTFEVSDGDVELSLDYSVEALSNGSVAVGASKVYFTVSDVAIADKVSGAAILGLPALRIENGSILLHEQSVSLDLIAIDSLRIDGWIDADGNLNFDQLFISEAAEDQITENISDESENVAAAIDESAEALAADGADSVAEEEDPLADWSLQLADFQINNFSAGFEDRSLTTPATLGIASLNASVQSITNEPGAAFPFSSQLNLLGGGTITEQGTITVLPEVVLDSSIGITGLQLAMFQPYVSEFVRMRIDSGELNVDATLRSDPEELVSFRGSVSIDKLDTQDMVKNVSLLDWQKLLIDDIAFRLDDNSLEVSRVLLDKPYVRFEIAEDASTNVGDLIVEQGAVEESSGTTDSEALKIQIGETDIRDGSANFADFSLPLPFATSIDKLDGDLSTISTVSSAPTRVKVRGQVDEYGTANIDGELKVFDPLNFMDITLAFANLNMPKLSPYTVEFVGQKIEAGKLDVDLGYKFVDGLMEGSNSVVINEFTLGEKVPNEDAMSLPLGLAVALLKDKDGVIDIDLAVSGDVNDPEFSVAGIVLKALGNLITKVATSPFRALGGLVGGDDIDLDLLQFEPGSAELTPPDREKLVKLGDALTQRPELQLMIPPTLDANADDLALRVAAVDMMIDAQLSEKDKQEDSPDMFIKRQRKILEKLYKDTSPDESIRDLRNSFKKEPPEGGRARLDEVAYSDELRNRLIALQTVTNEQLQQLAAARAQAVSAELTVAGVAENRISVTEMQPSNSEDAGLAAEWVEMKLEIDASALDTSTAVEATPEPEATGAPAVN